MNAVIQAGVASKVVMLSSLSAVHGDDDFPNRIFSEEDWNSSSSLSTSPWQLAKTVSERTAWKIYGSQFPRSPSRVTGAPSPFRLTRNRKVSLLLETENNGNSNFSNDSKKKIKKTDPFELVTLNVGTVLGPILTDRHLSASPLLIKQLLHSPSKICNPAHVPLVDVRDVAKSFISAFENLESSGRYLLVSKDLTFFDIANILRPLYPRPTFTLPESEESSWRVKIKGTILSRDQKIKALNLGKLHFYNIDKAKFELNFQFIDVEKTILETANSFSHFNLLEEDTPFGSKYVQILQH